MRILDLSAGNRAIWFDKKHPMATYLDIRPEMNPDIVCDTRNIHLDIGRYDLIVFDPPHTNCGPNGDMATRYGHFTSDEIRDLVSKTSREAHRVSKHGALMAFKWNDHSIKFTEVLKLMATYWEPLFGHTVKNNVGTKHRPDGTKTYWALLRRIDQKPFFLCEEPK